MDEPCSPVRNNDILGSGLTPAILTTLFSNRLSIHCGPWLLIIKDVLSWYPHRKRLLSYDMAVASPASSVKLTKKSNSGEGRSCTFLVKRKKGQQKDITGQKEGNRSQDLTSVS